MKNKKQSKVQIRTDKTEILCKRILPETTTQTT